MNESENECDFCGAKVPHLYPINDDLWAICKPCMDIHYTVLPGTQKEPKLKLTKSTRYNIYGEEE